MRRAIDHLLRVHEPFAAMVIDRDWNILQWNEGARRLWQWALDGRVAPPEVLTNAIRAATDPRALRPSIVNWDAIATTMAQHLQAECDAENDAERRARLARFRTAVGDAPRSLHASALPFVPLALRGFCPSCMGRRMAEGAALLVDHVLPRSAIASGSSRSRGPWRCDWATTRRCWRRSLRPSRGR